MWNDLPLLPPDFISEKSSENPLVNMGFYYILFFLMQLIFYKHLPATVVKAVVNFSELTTVAFNCCSRQYTSAIEHSEAGCLLY